MKNFYALPAGTCFKALILDIQPGRVTIRLEDGGKFTARTMILPDARIGEESYFRVKVNNFDGLIQLEMLRGSLGERQDNLVQEALRDAGLYNAQENMDLGRTLMDHNLPLDSQTLQKAAFFKNSESGSTGTEKGMEKALFLLQEGFPADNISLRSLESNLNPEKHLAKLLSQENVDMNAVRENLEFAQRVSKNVKYYQIPSIKDNEGESRVVQAELFVYPKGNAVIAIDSETYGRIEVNTDKNNKQLIFNFGSQTDLALNVLKNKSAKLVNALQKKGYQVSGLTYQKLGERTTVLTPGTEKTSGTTNVPAPPETRRYAFDMRV